MNPIDQFLQLNAEVTAEKVLWLQGAGGNTSLKEGPNLLVKPSGARLDSISTVAQLASIAIEPLRKDLENLEASSFGEDAYKQAIETHTHKGSARPSMESGFHAWLPGRFVFHFHSVASLLLGELLNNPIHLSEAIAFNEWYAQSWQNQLGSFTSIQPCLPGLELTLAIAKAAPSSIYWLRNHGVVLNFNEPTYLSEYAKFERAAMEKFFPEPAQFLRQLHKLNARQIIAQRPELLEAELKIYFPDLAIMYPRIMKQLKPLDTTATRFQWQDETADLDALENWLACSILQRILPKLPVLPEALCAQIPNLPTEIARKKMMESQS